MYVWKLFWKEKRNRVLFFVTLLALCFTLFLFLHFLTYNESRIGFHFDDPILRLFTPIDVSIFTFILTYGFAITGMVISFQKPEMFIKLLQCYTIITLLRMLCLYIIPLEPPVNIIPLQDPFLHSSFYSGRDNLKDLFFSGHTATMFLFAFLFNDKLVKRVFIFAGFLIGMLVMLQHVHYSIDVFAAPFVAYFVIFIHKI